MNYKDIYDALHALKSTSYKLEDTYIENGGEVTNETEALEEQKAALSDLLASEDAIDTLGRYVKALEDRKAALKAEKDKIAKMMEALDANVTRIKGTVNEILKETNREKAKGLLYGFTAYTSEKTTADKERIVGLYKEISEKAIRAAGVPSYITLALGASVSAVPEGTPLPDIFTVIKTPSARFSKPAKSKDRDAE